MEKATPNLSKKASKTTRASSTSKSNLTLNMGKPIRQPIALKSTRIETLSMGPYLPGTLMISKA